MMEAAVSAGYGFLKIFFWRRRERIHTISDLGYVIYRRCKSDRSGRAETNDKKRHGCNGRISGHEYYSDRNGRDKKERNKRLA